MEGLSPSKDPLIHPLGWKAIIETRRTELVRGARHFLGDSAALAAGTVDGGARRVEVGETLGEPGSGGLPQRGVPADPIPPKTEKVYTGPLLMVPPVINRFYILDISPGRSMIEYLVQQGSSGVRDLVANPDAAQPVWGCRHLRRGDPRRDGRGREDRALRTGPRAGVVLGRDPRPMTAAHLRPSVSRPLGQPHPDGTVLDQAKAGLASAIDGNSADIATALSNSRDTSTSLRWRRSSRWLRPTDLVGATGSTTTSRAGDRCLRRV